LGTLRRKGLAEFRQAPRAVSLWRRAAGDERDGARLTRVDLTTSTASGTLGRKKVRQTTTFSHGASVAAST
jgi:hypothetical protein